jgi:hypothetical protein
MTADCVQVKRIRLRMLAAGLAGLAFPACALEPKLPPLGLPSASMFSATLLPEREGVIPWKTFADVDSVKAGSKFTAQFGRAVLALDRQRIRVEGFILPLDATDGSHFLISAVPPHCPFCMPAGPDEIIEVFAKAPVAWGTAPVVMGGTLALMKDDPSGVLYRLIDAEPVATRAR